MPLRAHNTCRCALLAERRKVIPANPQRLLTRASRDLCRSPQAIAESCSDMSKSSMQESKRRRLVDLAGVKNVTSEALAKILKRVAEDIDIGLCSRPRVKT